MADLVAAFAGASTFDKPWGIALDSQNRIYAANDGGGISIIEQRGTAHAEGRRSTRRGSGHPRLEDKLD